MSSLRPTTFSILGPRPGRRAEKSSLQGLWRNLHDTRKAGLLPLSAKSSKSSGGGGIEKAIDRSVSAYRREGVSAFGRVGPSVGIGRYRRSSSRLMTKCQNGDTLPPLRP